MVKRSIPIWSALALALFGASCKSTYSERNVTSEPPPILRNDSRIYVAMPFDATFKKTVAQGSGKQTAQAIFASFNRYTKSVYLGKFPESVAEALESARRYNAEYVVYPHLLKWEDRATEWSGRRDQLEIKIDLIQLAESKLAFSREISGTGKWMSDGGDTPNDLLDQPIEEYVNALFRRVQKPSALW
jgi:hypothetical protein